MCSAEQNDSDKEGTTSYQHRLLIFILRNYWSCLVYNRSGRSKLPQTSFPNAVPYLFSKRKECNVLPPNDHPEAPLAPLNSWGYVALGNCIRAFGSPAKLDCCVRLVYYSPSYCKVSVTTQQLHPCAWLIHMHEWWPGCFGRTVPVGFLVTTIDWTT